MKEQNIDETQKNLNEQSDFKHKQWFNKKYGKDKQSCKDNLDNQDDIDSKDFQEKSLKSENTNNKKQANNFNENANENLKKNNKQEQKVDSTEDISKDEIETVKIDEYIKIKYQLAEVINKYKELSCEFDNYRKRTKEEIKDAKAQGKSQAIETILPALDNFKKAKQMLKDETSINGINIIEKSILASLEKLDIKKINCIGKPFNPDFHNAILMVEDKTHESGTVVDEMQAGYMCGEKVIKFSQVIVAK